MSELQIVLLIAFLYFTVKFVLDITNILGNGSGSTPTKPTQTPRPYAPEPRMSEVFEMGPGKVEYLPALQDGEEYTSRHQLTNFEKYRAELTKEKFIDLIHPMMECPACFAKAYCTSDTGSCKRTLEAWADAEAKN